MMSSSGHCHLLFVLVILQLLLLCDAFNGANRKVTIASIQHKVTSEPLPLFEFAREVDEIMVDPSISLTEIHMLHQSYLDALKDHYLMKFRNEMIHRCSNFGDVQQFKKHILKEAEAAMKAAAPSACTGNVSIFLHLNHILELETDIDVEICNNGVGISLKEIEEERIVLGSASQKGLAMWKARLWTPVNRKRIKWVASQILMLLVNYAQFELNRKMSEYAAEKRLAEIPEFPLL